MRFPARPFLIALLMSLLSLATAPFAHAVEPELRVISLKHRLAEDVVAVIRPLLAPGDSISGLDSRLIVRASPRTFAQIERLLVDIDTPRRNLRISVRHAGEREQVQENTGVTGDLRRGNTRIVVTNGTRDAGGITAGRVSPDGTIQLHSERRITTTRDTSAQNLTVLDGGRAFLRVGESIPQVQAFLALVGNRPGLITGIQYYDVTTGFDVEPRILGDRIQLAVTPRLAFRGNQGMQTVNFQELSTVITVKPGEWTDLGGTVALANEVNRQILGTRHRADNGDSRFLIRVDLL